MGTPSREVPSLLAVGPWKCNEFVALRNELDPLGHWPSSLTLNDAVNHAENAALPPELILLAQPRPGLDDQSDIERCRRAWPLTRIIVIAGSWCEGELRTGRPPAGVIRLYWHEFSAWWRSALNQVAENRTPPWSHPLTANLTSMCATAGSTSIAPRVHGQHANAPILAIDAPDYGAFEAIEQAAKPAGWQCHWQPRHRPELWSKPAGIHPTAALWDGAQLDAHERRALQQFCARLAPVPVIALLDFPRSEHIELSTSAGAAAILGKPYAVSTLRDELNRILRLPPLGGEGWGGGTVH